LPTGLKADINIHTPLQFKKDELKGLSGSQNQVMFLTFKPQSNMKPQIYISRSLQINVLLDEYSLEKH